MQKTNIFYRIRLLYFIVAGLGGFGTIHAARTPLPLNVYFENTIEIKQDSIGNYKKLLEKAVTSKGVIDVHKVENEYYFEIADRLFEREFLIVNKVSAVPYALNTAGLNNGMEYQSRLIRFHKDSAQKKIWVSTIDPKAVVNPESNIAASVKKNYGISIIEYFPIEAYGENSVVIKVNKVFDGSRKSFNDLYNNISLGSSVIQELSSIKKIKSFRENIVVKSLLTTSVSEGNEAVPLTVETSTNIVLLPEEAMTPRFADPRIGYFSSPKLYFDDIQQKVGKREVIHRWRLEPKPEDRETYKQGILVEPLKPIVFYIDPATPEKWIKNIELGVLDWNKAFEAAGFKNAVQVKHVRSGDPDFDIEDVRYSVITYAASELANAMGPSVIDPRSGEIIEADVIWSHNVMTLLHSWMRIQTGPTDPMSRPNILDDTHMANGIRFVASHEIGHTFGLKHNMGASSSYPVDSLRSPKFTEKMGTASSIMDYARFNYVAQPEDGVTYLTPLIGTYDKHAINWGYRWTEAKRPEEESRLLDNWLRAHENDRKFRYGAQQNPKDPIDPRSQDEDLGDDIVKANTYGIENLKRIVPNIAKWTEEAGKGYAEAGKLLMGVINQWKTYADHVTANVGGFYIEYPVPGNDLKRFEPVPAQIQRQSVKFLIEHVFNIPEWLFKASIWEKTFPVKMGVEYGPYNTARELQYAVFYNLLKDERIMRMLESEVMEGKENTYTAEALFDDVFRAVFKKKEKKPDIFGRMRQKNFIDAVIVSSNKTVEKTTKKGIDKICTYCNEHIEYPNRERNIADLHISSMARVSEVVSVKRGILIKALRFSEKRIKSSEKEVKHHYEDLIIRIKEALNYK